MPAALKLDVLMDKLQERNDRKLAELTGLDSAVVARCKKLLTYSKKYQDRMLDPDPAKREKADFFIELYPIISDREVRQMAWFERDKFTQRMLDKYHNPESDLKAVTDFRRMKQCLTNAKRAEVLPAIGKRLQEYAQDDSLSMDHLVIPAADRSAGAKKLLNAVEKLEKALERIAPEEYYGEQALWESLERLYRLIRKKLEAADRRVKP
jgi:hypothetical protein